MPASHAIPLPSGRSCNHGNILAQCINPNAHCPALILMPVPLGRLSFMPGEPAIEPAAPLLCSYCILGARSRCNCGNLPVTIPGYPAPRLPPHPPVHSSPASFPSLSILHDGPWPWSRHCHHWFVHTLPTFTLRITSDLPQSISLFWNLDSRCVPVYSCTVSK